MQGNQWCLTSAGRPPTQARANRPRHWARLNSCWSLCTHKLMISAYYSFIDPERMKGWVDLVGWPAADGLPTWVVTRQLQVGRRTGKVRRPKYDVLPLSQRHQLSAGSPMPAPVIVYHPWDAEHTKTQTWWLAVQVDWHHRSQHAADERRCSTPCRWWSQTMTQSDTARPMEFCFLHRQKRPHHSSVVWHLHGFIIRYNLGTGTAEVFGNDEQQWNGLHAVPAISSNLIHE